MWVVCVCVYARARAYVCACCSMSVEEVRTACKRVDSLPPLYGFWVLNLGS